MIQEAGCNFCTSMSLVLNQYNYIGYIQKKVCIKLGIKISKNKHKIPPQNPKKMVLRNYNVLVNVLRQITQQKVPCNVSNYKADTQYL